MLIHSLGVLLVPHHSVHTAEGIPAQTVEIRMLAVTYVMLCPRMYVRVQCLCLHQERIILFGIRSCIDVRILCADRSAVCALPCKGVVVSMYIRT